MLAMSQSRGEDATGIFRGGNNPGILKANIPAENMIALPEFMDFFTETTTYLAHTRKSTKGTPDENKNNHPLWFGDYVIAHNGSLTNTPSEKLDADVDSSWFPWAFSKKNPKSPRSVAKLLSDVSGTFALSIYHLPTRTTMLIRDNYIDRAIYYTVQEQYVRYSQIPDESLKELEPYELLIITSTSAKIKQINVNVPFALLDFISSIDISKLTSPKDAKNLIIAQLETNYPWEEKKTVGVTRSYGNNNWFE